MNCMRWFVRLDTPSCSVIARASQSRIVVKMRWQVSSNIGELGSAGCGPRKSRAQTASAPASPVTVHRSQHFRSRHTNLSCSGAPLFGVDGRLIAVLDVSAIDPELSERAHALTGVLTVRSARAIEERFVREQFRREWIVAVAPPEGGAPSML